MYLVHMYVSGTDGTHTAPLRHSLAHSTSLAFSFSFFGSLMFMSQILSMQCACAIERASERASQNIIVPLKFSWQDLLSLRKRTITAEENDNGKRTTIRRKTWQKVLHALWKTAKDMYVHVWARVCVCVCPRISHISELCELNSFSLAIFIVQCTHINMNGGYTAEEKYSLYIFGHYGQLPLQHSHRIADRFAKILF